LSWRSWRFTSRGLPIDVYAAPGNQHLLAFPLAEAIHAVEWYEDFFGTPYSGPRLQIVAVPNFAMGGMENQFLILQRESCTLGEVGKSSHGALKSASGVTTHEIAHQWVGDLVSPKWWTDLFLNESFATVLPYVLEQETHPDWKTWEDFLSYTFQGALVSDSDADARPIVRVATTDEEIEGLFDDITYGKGASCIRMLIAKVGFAKFKAAMQVYIARHKDACADADALYAVFDEVIGAGIGDFFKAWTTQANFPLVTYADGVISQKRFTNVPGEHAEWWPVPLSIVYKDRASGEIRETEVDLGAAPVAFEGAEWVKLNHGVQAYCRCAYKDVSALFPAIEAKQIPAADRWELIVDARAQAKLGMISWADVVTLLGAYREEDDPFVAGALAATFTAILKIFPALTAEIKPLGTRVLGGILERIGAEAVAGEHADVAALRTQLLASLALTYGHEPTIERMRALWSSFLADRASVPALLVRGLLRTAVYRFDGLEVVKTMSQSDPQPEFKNAAVYALGSCPEHQIDAVLKYALTAPFQDILSIITGVTIHPTKGERAWEFAKENWDVIYEKFKSVSFMLPGLIEYALGRMCKDEEADAEEAWFAEHPCPVADSAIKQGLTGIRQRAASIARDGEKLRAALLAFGQ
jgi:puromycin-sensitive aminopeptidase